MFLLNFISRAWDWVRTELCHCQYKKIHKSARIHYTVSVSNTNNLIMEENTNIDSGAVIMNTRANFVMKKNSGAAVGLLAITGNHMSVIGKYFKQITDKIKDELDINHEMDKDIIVEEDVWIAARVTLLSGTNIGRGAVVGAGSVIRSKVPPYAIVVGNPAKIVGFKFSPEQIIQHEKELYPLEERLPFETLEKNYKKYFLDRVSEIKSFTRI